MHRQFPSTPAPLTDLAPHTTCAPLPKLITVAVADT